MSYNEFTLSDVIKVFNLNLTEKAGIFRDVVAIEPSVFLQETLTENLPLALGSNTEKSRSELIISPILVELRRYFDHKITFFSGVNFNIDPARGLNGNCDFLITGSEELLFILNVARRPSPYFSIKALTKIVKKASGYYVIITFQSSEECPEHPVGEKFLGIDAGIESFVATSQGELIKSPKFLQKALRKLKLLQRRLKHKKIGSKNWLKLQQKIAKIHERVANTRKDWHFKTAHHLCDQTNNIFVEDINFKSWSRGIVIKQSLESGIGGFINEILPFVCWKRGKVYLKVNKDGTSQECPNCGTLTGKKKLNQRVHNCQFCGHTESRDSAAAKVILRRGLSAVGRTVQPEPTGQNAHGVVLPGGHIQLSLFDLSEYDSRNEAAK